MLKKKRFLLVFLCLFSCGEKSQVTLESIGPKAEFRMVDASPKSGLNFATMSGSLDQLYITDVKSTGVGLLDFDSDGLLDIVLVAGSSVSRKKAGQPGFGVRLYRNLGNLKFEDASKAAGLDQIDWGWACAPACADVDGDGDDDLYVSQIGQNILLLNDGGYFRQAENAGLKDEGWGTSAVFADFDRDGDLDLYQCNYLTFDFENPPRDGEGQLSCRWKGNEVMCGPKGLPPQADVIYQNDGTGHFENVTKKWGLDRLTPSFGLGVIAGDFDANGTSKIYVANDGMANFFLRWNPTTKKFVDEAYGNGLALSEDGAPQAGMGLDGVDLNHDGFEDFICTNFSNEVNNLYLSADEQFYSDSSGPSGMALESLATLGWGVGFRDFNLDGQEDLFVANGHVYPQAASVGTNTDYPQFNQLFLGDELGRFSLQPRLKHSGLAVKKVSRGAAFGDLDNDGDVDVVICNLNDEPTLIENRTRTQRGGPNFVGVSCRAGGKNAQGIGALVERLDGKGRQTVRRQASFQSSNDARIIMAGQIEKLSVLWPSGLREVFEVQPNQYNRLEEKKKKK